MINSGSTKVLDGEEYQEEKYFSICVGIHYEHVIRPID